MLIKPARRDLTIRSIGIEDKLLGKSFSLACIKLGIKPAKINAIKNCHFKIDPVSNQTLAIRVTIYYEKNTTQDLEENYILCCTYFFSSNNTHSFLQKL